MKLFNYLRVLGVLTNAHQPIALDVEPTDRSVRKMVEEANELIQRGWARRLAFLQKRQAEANEEFDEAAEHAAFHPKTEDGKVLMPLQYIQDYLVRRIAAVQTIASIHDAKAVKELREVFAEFGVMPVQSVDMVFSHINWSARENQKPKLLIHGTDEDGPVCVRLEAASELCQKSLNALMALDVVAGTKLTLQVEAVDPAIERNRAAKKQVVAPGKYVNHNLTVIVGDKRHTGHPEKGTRFVQKPTIEDLERLFRTVNAHLSKTTS